MSSFNTENVTCMSQMFYNCYSLTEVNLSSFNTQNVTIMAGMFTNCISLTTLDLSSFKTSKIDSEGMFDGCNKLLSCGSTDKNIIDAFNKK